ncbi:MAG: gluconeogenesis factor YvcK family protein [Thermovenabulum sp.]|uniref:gluconeogenesis factor YvcK family protein n=1 Tax=Thermovenabulum sp. TaxID=3100335 RepID=UPI003C7DCC33
MLKVVAIGGGTGLPALLRGLKYYTKDITAIVTVADDGGSSGRLRDELKMPPPGDIRNCLLALANTEPLMEKLFQYRFDTGFLKGHSFGNLFLAALTEVLGDFELAIKESSKVLAVSGQVIPSTLDDVTLMAEYEDGSVAIGESLIPRINRKIKRVKLIPEDARPLTEAIEAIKKADAIIIGPGSLYTSIIPNLLIKEIKEAIENSGAKKIFVVNIMTQPGETDNYTAYDHIKAIIDHAGEKVIEYVLVNVEKIPEKLLKKYKDEGSIPVLVDEEKIISVGYKIIKSEVLSFNEVIRHDSEKLAREIMNLFS